MVEVLSDAALECMIEVLRLCVFWGAWPTTWRTRILFILKAPGGLRPIAAQHWLIRIYARIFKHEWEIKMARPYLWAAKNMSVEKCVWVQSAYAEWSTIRRLRISASAVWSKRRGNVDTQCGFLGCLLWLTAFPAFWM